MKSFKIRIKLLSLLLTAALVFGNTAAVLADEPAGTSAVSEIESIQNEDQESLTDASDLPDAENTETEEEVQNAEDEQPNPADPAEQQDPAESDNEDPEKTDNEEPEQTEEQEALPEDPSEESEPGEMQDDANPEETADEAEEIPEGSAEETEEIEPVKASPVLSGSFNENKTTYTLVLTGDSVTGSDYFEARVWSHANGEDDLKTVQLTTSDGSSYSVQLTIADFKDPGNYTASVYKVSGDESSFVEEIEFTVPAATAGTISISSLNKTTGTAKISVKGLTSESGFKSVSAKVWNKSGKSDLYTYKMTENSGVWSVSMDIAKHKNVKGVYNIEVYSVDGNGFESLSATGTVDFAGFTGKITTATKGTNGKYTVKLSGFSSSDAVKGVRIALWSNTKGQDDLQWHDMTADSAGTTYTFSSYIKDFKHFGKINAHIYVDKTNGKSEFFGEKVFKIKAPTATATVAKTNAKTGAFAITTSGISSDFTVTKLKVLVWKQADKSDKKWYTMTKSSDTKYVLSGANIQQFKSFSGTYNAAVYAYTKNGPSAKIGSTTFDFAASSGTIAYADKNAGTKGEEQKEYKLSVRGLAQEKGITKVEFKVWPTSNTSAKQWFTATYKNGCYTANVPISSFKIGGQYRAQVYVTDTTGAKKSVKSKDVMNVDGAVGGKVVITSSDPDTGKFTIALKKSDSPSGLTSVKFTVWTLSDKSDAHTFYAKKQSGGTFTAVVNISKLNYNTGTFHVQAKTVMGNGIPKNRKSADVTFNVKENFVFVKKTATGKRTVGVINPSSGSVKFAIWSEKNGQDDLHWYNGTKSGKKWTANVNLTDFNDIGTYDLHVYSGDNFLTDTTFKVADGEAGKTGWYYENGLKFYYKAGKKLTDLSGMVGGPYQICVNRQCNTITIYALDGGNGYIIPVIAFVCSTGLPGMETPTGVYYTYAKNRWEELMGPTWGQYSARVVDGIYIHSMPSNIPYSHHGIPWSEYNKLGSPASHGCIRVNVAAAKWIYEHCGVGTEVKIYDSSNPGPFGKPTAPKMTPDMDWDPTDPEMQ